MKTVIEGGQVVDPEKSSSEELCVLIEKGLIVAVDVPSAMPSGDEVRTIDARGKYILPGLIDIHVHLREPGQEWKETVASGALAAVSGGFTTICCMPNTDPVNDSAQVTEFILERALVAELARVHPIGAISKGLEGKALAPMMELQEAGCVAFSDDGRPVWDSALMRKALEYGRGFGATLMLHEEDLRLSDGFAMNESALSLELGLKGMPEAAENVMIARDIELARLTGAPIHFCHVSTARGALLIKRAKEDGIPVTAEVAPHHLILTEESVRNYDTAAKMSMPLRTEADCEGLLEALATGVIDCVASDHAPHENDSKRCEFDKASFGMIGLQTTLPLMLHLVRDGKLSLSRAIAALTTDAAKCLGLEAGSLRVGQPADLVIVDPQAEFILDEKTNRSMSANTPFWGRPLCGAVDKTLVGGSLVYEREEEHD